MKRRALLMKWTPNRTTKKADRKRLLTFQPLESRELMAVMGPFDSLDADAPRISPSRPAGLPRPAAVAGIAPGTSGELVDSGGISTRNPLVNDFSVRPTGGIVVDPPPAPVRGAKFENGVLTVTGSNEADTVFIEASYVVNKWMLHVVDESGMQGADRLLSVPLVDLQRIVVNGHGGDDVVVIDDQTVNVPATLRGDEGNDELYGGAAGDELFGGAGNDRLGGRGGNDTIRGGDGDDVLGGGAANDVIFGGFGNDDLIGNAGNDWLIGEEGDDLMSGDAGNDLLLGGPGVNKLLGGDGDDVIYGGEDRDFIWGGFGNDFIRGFGGADQLRGEDGHDRISGDDGNDAIYGGAGDDQLDGNNGNDLIKGGDGNDILSGGSGLDWLQGNAGDDMLDG